MQHEKALKLMKEWGNKPCNHPNVEKEYYLGTDTGDKVCTQCGHPVFFHTGEKIHDDKPKGE
jgi:hypothetical protein